AVTAGLPLARCTIPASVTRSRGFSRRRSPAEASTPTLTPPCLHPDPGKAVTGSGAQRRPPGPMVECTLYLDDCPIDPAIVAARSERSDAARRVLQLSRARLHTPQGHAHRSRAHLLLIHSPPPHS